MISNHFQWEKNEDSNIRFWGKQLTEKNIFNCIYKAWLVIIIYVHKIFVLSLGRVHKFIQTDYPSIAYSISDSKSFFTGIEANAESWVCPEVFLE